MDRYDPYTDKFLRDTQYDILSTNLASLDTDLISRQAAIDVAKEELDNGTFYDIPSKIESLPSAQPERKKGKWIIRDNPGTGWYRVTCSECGEDVTSTIPMIGFFPNAKPLWDYCPWCGVKMGE